MEKIIGIVKEGELGELSKEELCRKHGMSKSAYYQWTAKYGSMEVSEAVRLKELEDENRRLKQIIADQTLDIQMLNYVNKNSGEPCRPSMSFS